MAVKLKKMPQINKKGNNSIVLGSQWLSMVDAG